MGTGSSVLPQKGKWGRMTTPRFLRFSRAHSASETKSGSPTQASAGPPQHIGKTGRPCVPSIDMWPSMWLRFSVPT